MANMIDYLDTMGQKTLAEAPFNEVDSLVLCTVIYSDLKDCVRGLGAGALSVREVRDRFVSKLTGVESRTWGRSRKFAAVLIDRMVSSRRFGRLKFRDYIDLVDPDEEMQLAAVTAELDDRSVYVAFRGTDSTLVGWKEDFNFSFMNRTTGQVTAAKYLNRVLAGVKGPVRVGGHSKGGNFAVYAAAFCDPAVGSKIVRVYSNDGPGVNEKIAAHPAYQAVLPKVIKLIPEESIIGLLLSGQGQFRIVKSTETGVMQHDLTSWIIEGDHLARSMSRSADSVFLDRTISDWISGLSHEEREKFVNSLYRVLRFTGAETVSDLKDNRIAAAAGVVVAMASLSLEDQAMLWEIIARLADSGKQNGFSSIALSQIRTAMQITQTVSGVAKAASDLFSGIIPKKQDPPPIPYIPPLADDKIMTDEVKELLEKYK